jgi:hypothetical protein
LKGRYVHQELTNLASIRQPFSATITDDTMLARRYFQEAVTLGPSDARTLGFLAGHTLAEGTLHKDELLTRHADSPQFRDGLGWQWEALDIRPLHAWVVIKRYEET